MTCTEAPATGTLSTMFAEGKGVLVLDRHAEEIAATSRPAVDVEQLRTTVMTAPGLSDVISTVLLTFDGLVATATERPRSQDPGIITGVCLRPDLVDAEVLGEARANDARLVELRSNLGPGMADPKQPATQAQALARGARAVQATGMVAVVTFAMPDLGTQSARVTYAVTANALRALVTACDAEGVDPATLVVRTNMITAGTQRRTDLDPHDVGRATVAVLAETLPATLGGVLLLSGGVEANPASANLAAVVATAAEQRLPWPVTFAFCRPLVRPALRAYGGGADSVTASNAVSTACRVAAEALTTTATP